MSVDLVLIGAGGHGKVVADALLCLVPTPNFHFADQNPARHHQTIFDRRVVDLDWSSLPESFHVSIGDNTTRARLAMAALTLGKRFHTIIHPAAIVSPRAVVASGVFVAAGAVVAPGSTIRTGCIINHGAVIDHDCQIDEFAHVAPGAVLGGNVVIGSGVLVGSSSVVLPGLRIGRGSVVGAGAVVTNDVGEGLTVVGVPARILRGSAT